MANKNDALIREARERFETGIDFERENREAALDDLRFVAGEQWPDEAKRMRQNRPMLTINRMPQFIRQVSNEIRLKPPAIDVLPVEDADQATAEVMGGLIRSIERRSKAQRIYAMGAEDSARCSQGFWRVKTEYTSDEVFEQDLTIEFIHNPLSVVFDPAATELTRADAEWCIVYDDMPIESFKAAYPKAATSGFEKYGSTTATDANFSWGSKETVRVAEYWVVKQDPDQIALLENGQTICVDEYDELVQSYQAATAEHQAMVAQGVDAPPPPPPPGVARSPDGKPMVRSVKRRKVQMYMISGAEVLSGPHEWPGQRIPIVPVWGEEVRVGHRVVRSSVIRWAKDPQRMLNYWRSASVEALALAPKAPWLVTAAQIKGHEPEWAGAGNGNPPYLVYNPDGSAGGPPQRQMPPQVQGAMLQESALASDDLKSTTGIYDASLGAQSNETSGKAIMARQREGDVGTYVFVDNLMAAIEETGRILVDVIPKIYDTKRQVRILGKKDEYQVVEVNTGKYDLTRGKYDVTVSAGASFTTRRQEMAEAFTELLRSAPQLAPVLIPRMAEVLDFPDAKDVAAEIRAMMQPQPQGDGAPPVNPKDQAQAEKYRAEAKATEIQNFQSLQAMGQPYDAVPGGAVSMQPE